MPVKKFEAIHKGLGAKTANKDQAENLPAEVSLNGSLGAIRDIVWEEGKPKQGSPISNNGGVR